MNKYAHALQHGLASVTGWFHLRSTQPRFAGELLRRRWRYFRHREFHPGFVTPDGFPLSTPDTLIAYWSMFVERELYHPDWVAALQAESQPFVVDVGANAGLFSHLAHHLNHKAKIVAFEPLPVMVGHINHLKQRNHMNLHCIPKAVGRASGTAMLESPHGYDGTSRISTSAQPTGQTFPVEVVTLDQELKGRSVLVMKIDVEGFEDEVIAGARETLSRTKFLIIEAHDAARRRQLAQLLGRAWSWRRLGSSDCLFTRG